MSDVDTMAGYLITALGVIPDENKKIPFEVDNFILTTEEVEGSRVLRIHVEVRNPENTEVEPEEERRFFRKDFDDDEPRR